MAKPYVIAGELFPTQAELERRVKEHLNSHPVNDVFGDPFLRNVINTLHEEVRAAGQHCSGVFEYLTWEEQLRRGLDSADRYRGGCLLRCWFEPLGDWRDVTAYPWRKSKPEQEIKRALREKIAFFLPRPQTSDRCHREGCRESGSALEYEHIRPTFNAIADECLALMAPEEIATRFGYSKFTPGRDELVHCIPNVHPAVVRLIALHEANEWEWLCSFHHRGVRPLELVVA